MSRLLQAAAHTWGYRLGAGLGEMGTQAVWFLKRELAAFSVAG